MHFHVHEDRVEVSNPGGFPDGVGHDHFLFATPNPRNPILADALKRAGIVDRISRGINMIFEQQVRCGRHLPRYDPREASQTSLSVPRNKPDMVFVRLITELGRLGYDLELVELLILDWIWNNRVLTTRRAHELLQKSETETKEILARLVAERIIARSPSKKGFVVNPELLKGISAKLRGEIYRSFPHVASKTPRSQKASSQSGSQKPSKTDYEKLVGKVMAFVKKRGKITRRETANLCRIDPIRSRKVLSMLTDK